MRLTLGAQQDDAPIRASGERLRCARRDESPLARRAPSLA